MGPTRRRRTIVVTSLVAYAVLLVLGPPVLGGWAGGVILVASYAVGFECLLLVVAPWAVRGRHHRHRSATPHGGLPRA
ncbi:hypothetical protein [Terrabacter sp. BE26]|uniref:hypothetical protein n=1 Tax=Terrabacter sp. BE26 TaxID=2898152 RepID=UPI0035BE9738